MIICNNNSVQQNDLSEAINAMSGNSSHYEAVSALSDCASK